MAEKRNDTIGVPGTEERLALAAIEDQLRQVRGRFNCYTVQHHLYRLGTILAVGTALLVVGAFLLTPVLFTLLSWPVLVLLAFCFLFFLRRGVVDWENMNEIARRVDAKVGLKERLSTLVAQLTGGVIGKSSPSSLWSHLLAENTLHLDDWEVKTVAPARIPWSIGPFLMALLLLLFVSLLPMLSDRSIPNPFSPDNVQAIVEDFPNHVGEFIDRQLSLLPDSQNQWGGSTIFNAPQHGEGKVQGSPENNTIEDLEGGEEDRPEAQSFASLPQALQEKIRQALQGLPDKKKPATLQEAQPAEQDRRVALQPDKEQKKSNPTMEEQAAPSEEKSADASRGRGGKKKEAAASGKGAGVAMPAPSLGTGIQQLEHAQLDRKSGKGTFQPESPQVPGSGGDTGEGGPGAGSGTDPRLYGEQKATSKDGHTFPLALETTHEKSYEGESDDEENDTGGIVEKSTKGLSEKQALDDAIRKSQVPAEYEDIVKRLFVRGESR